MVNHINLKEIVLKMDIEMITKLKSIEWFSNVGNPVNITLYNHEIEFVASWSEAQEHYIQASWEEKTLEARNELTVFLFNKYKDKYSKWNTITKEAKPVIEEILSPKIKMIESENSLDAVFADCVKWDVLSAVMENEFKECKGVPSFFTKLLEIYEKGHFPCGWDSSCLNGKLYVF